MVLFEMVTYLGIGPPCGVIRKGGVSVCPNVITNIGCRVSRQQQQSPSVNGRFWLSNMQTEDEMMEVRNYYAALSYIRPLHCLGRPGPPPQ